MSSPHVKVLDAARDDVSGLLNSTGSINRFQKWELTLYDLGCGPKYSVKAVRLCLSGAPVPDCDGKCQHTLQ